MRFLTPGCLALPAGVAALVAAMSWCGAAAVATRCASPRSRCWSGSCRCGPGRHPPRARRHVPPDHDRSGGRAGSADVQVPRKRATVAVAANMQIAGSPAVRTGSSCCRTGRTPRVHRCLLPPQRLRSRSRSRPSRTAHRPAPRTSTAQPCASPPMSTRRPPPAAAAPTGRDRRRPGDQLRRHRFLGRLPYRGAGGDERRGTACGLRRRSRFAGVVLAAARPPSRDLADQSLSKTFEQVERSMPRSSTSRLVNTPSSRIAA
jgi:hypothetical protein